MIAVPTDNTRASPPTPTSDAVFGPVVRDGGQGRVAPLMTDAMAA